MRKSYKNCIKHQKFSIFGSNSNGLKGKLDSLKSSLEFFQKPSCVNIQETKLRSKGTVKLEGYQVFEKIRNGLGGGLLTSAGLYWK